MKKWVYHLYAFIAAVCAGLIGLFVKLIDGNMHFMTISFYRLLFATALLLVVVPFIDRKTFKVRAADMKGYFVSGILIAATLSAFATANVFAPISNVSLLFNTAPFFAFVFAYLILGEKLNRVKIIAAVIAIIGLIILNPFRQGDYLLGNILSLSAAILFSITIIQIKRERKTHGLGDILWFFAFATLLLLPAPFVYGWGDLNGNVLWYVLGLGLIATGAQFLFYNLALKKIEAEVQTSITTIFLPVVAVLTAVLFIGETLSLRTIVGGVLLIFAGVYLEMSLLKSKK